MEQQQSQSTIAQRGGQDRVKEKSLAWFKLSELIARGEREKALSVFRLLSHSLPDRAYVLQIEGDILWYLDDKGSVEKYKQAAFLYQKEKRWIDAISVYEHLFTQTPKSGEILSSLLVFYAIIDWPEKFTERFISFAQLLTSNHIDNAQAEKTIHDIIDGLHTAESSNKQHWLSVVLPQHVSLLPENLAAQIKII